MKRHTNGITFLVSVLLAFVLNFQSLTLSDLLFEVLISTVIIFCSIYVVRKLLSHHFKHKLLRRILIVLATLFAIYIPLFIAGILNPEIYLCLPSLSPTHYQMKHNIFTRSCKMVNLNACGYRDYRWYHFDGCYDAQKRREIYDIQGNDVCEECFRDGSKKICEAPYEGGYSCLDQQKK